jgi:hypothetical protein
MVAPAQQRWETMPRKHEEQGQRAGRLQITLGTQLITCSALVILAQGLLWLWQGQWTPFTVEEILRWAGTGAPMIIGPNASGAVEWLLALPISAGIAGIGFVIAWMGASKLVTAARN